MLERRSSELGRKLGEARQTGKRPEKTVAGMVRAVAMRWVRHSDYRPSSSAASSSAVRSAGTWMGWLGNKKPWLFILFFLLGAAAGMLNIIRTAMREKTPPLPSVKDERDEDN